MNNYCLRFPVRMRSNPTPFSMGREGQLHEVGGAETFHPRAHTEAHTQGQMPRADSKRPV